MISTSARSGNFEKDSKTQSIRTKNPKTPPCKTKGIAKKNRTPENRATKTCFCNSRAKACKPAWRIKAMGNLDLESLHHKGRNYQSNDLLY